MDFLQTNAAPSDDIHAEIREFVTEPRSLRFLTVCCVRELVAESNECSVKALNEIIDTLPVLHEELKAELRVKI